MKYTVVIIFFLIGILNIGNFLDITQEINKADVIICLGGEGRQRVVKSVKLLENGYSISNKLYYSWNKENINNDTLLKKHFLNGSLLFFGKLTNTMEEILHIDKLIQEKNFNSVIIVTDPPHARRIDIMIKEFAKHLNNNYIIVSSNPEWWSRSFYFLSIQAIKFSIKELFKIPYNLIKYKVLGLYFTK